MPNSQNKGKANKNAGQGHPDNPDEQKVAAKPNTERSDLKQGRQDKDSDNTDRTSSQGRKEASGGGNNT